MFTERVHTRVARRELTRQNVLDAAERLFRNQGFGSTTVRQIAADAGVSIGTVMAVGDKDALLIAIFDGWIAAVHRDRSNDPDTDEAELTPEAATRAVLGVFEPFVGYFALDRELSREYAAIIVRGTHRSEVFQTLASALIAEIIAVLSRSSASRATADRDARVIYFGYLGILMAAASGALVGRAVIDQLHEVVECVTHREGEQR